MTHPLCTLRAVALALAAVAGAAGSTVAAAETLPPLGGYGWDVRIRALGDFDGDGRPDFLFDIGGSNSGHQALALSSKARPGRNPPTTYLSWIGC